jgi:hypothetical protein
MHHSPIKFLLLLLLSISSLIHIQSVADELNQRIILLGDAGYSQLSPLEPSLQLAAAIAKQAPNKSNVVFLGDNIYTKGFPVLQTGQTAFNQSQLKQISYLTAQLDVARISGSPLYMLPGNHDWKPKQVDDQAAYIASYAETHKIKASLVPFNIGQEPLPEIVHLEGISLLFIDSTWWLQKHGKNIEKLNKRIDSLLNQTSKTHPNNILLLTSHHPIKSVGPHGNFGKADECIKDIKCKHRKVGDIAHPIAQKAFKTLKQRLSGLDRVIYAAGHDHSLQVFEFDNGGKAQISLVSGAANSNKISEVGEATDNIFSLSEVGFMVLDIYQKKCLLTVYTADKSKVVFEKVLF